MRAVVQRVKRAEVRVDDRIVGAVSKGFLVYLGVEKGDSLSDLEYISTKLENLRVFEDSNGKMNLDLKEAEGELLIVSQFTLAGDVRKGRRPSFDKAEAPERAKELYEAIINNLRGKGFKVEKGEFQAHMEVESINDGPVTLLLDSRKVF
ncbi:MAG: D-tyrosyl-tRNA(Tyr) deacylase [Deltaproteobacteria bacterium]|nr:D-tyrosyl-tRNA(Tyr) deacylase [Deltaproteobacteria bacterium]